MDSEPLASISPNKMQAAAPLEPPHAPFVDDGDGVSLEGSDYSIIEYNIPSMAASIIGEKHSRSVNNSPMKSAKKTKYDSPREESKENYNSLVDLDDDVFSPKSKHDEDDDDENIDADMSGFSELTLTKGEAGISRELQESLGERSVDRQLFRESYRTHRSSGPNTPTKSTFPASHRHSWASPRSDPATPGTVTPKAANGTISRIATLSQYSKSPESTPGADKTTNLLLDFTAQFNAARAFPTPTGRPRRRSQSASPTKGLREGETPRQRPLPAPTPNEKKFLIDFDIPPPPTPRSIPSITPKEVENIKSQYLAQLAQLKAELAGKDAQIQTLRDAVSDAERRASNGIVELRQVREEMEDMSARSMLMESKLHDAGRLITETKEQNEASNERLEAFEKDLVAQKKELEESRQENEHLSDQLLKSKQELISVKKDLIVEQQKRASTPSNSPSRAQSNDVEAAVTKAVAAANATKDMEIGQAVEKVAKELHTLYKGKHEQKVQALKASYAKRWEKRIAELENKNAELTASNNDLSNKITKMEEENEENLTGPVVSTQEVEAQKAEIEKLHKLVAKNKEHIAELQQDLELERQEKGELVLAVDELLALGGVPGVSEAGMGSLRGSVSRASGVGIARGLSPVKQRETESRSKNLRGGIENMGRGAGVASASRFGFPK